MTTSGPRLVSTWWATWIATTAINLAETLGVRARDLDGIHTRAILDTISAATTLAAGVLLILAQITRWQTTPRDPAPASPALPEPTP